MQIEVFLYLILDIRKQVPAPPVSDLVQYKNVEDEGQEAKYKKTSHGDHGKETVRRVRQVIGGVIIITQFRVQFYHSRKKEFLAKYGV